MSLEKLKTSTKDLITTEKIDELKKIAAKIKIDKKILSEDTYSSDIDKIIERDFFPDFIKLRDQAEYLDAWDRNDVETVRKLQLKYSGSKRPGSVRPDTGRSSPSTFETPDIDKRHSPKSQLNEGDVFKKLSENNYQLTEEEQQAFNNKLKISVSLDKYLHQNTSEDNASFNDIMEEYEKQHRLKHAWLFEKETEQYQKESETLALPSIEKQAIEDSKGKIETWQYKAKNALMYVPDAVPETEKELINKKPREIIHENTRFKSNPFNLSQSKQSIADAASNQGINKAGKIGIDGKEVLPTVTPKVRGYGFVATPSPAPGVNESPLMTWGEVESTPFRLDGGGTPGSTPGPSFKIPDVPLRDKLALELADKAKKAHSYKKEKAIHQVCETFVPSAPKFGSVRSTDRLKSMSHAAQRLASSGLKLGSFSDKALRASYTPSPSQSPKTDIKTPKHATPKNTPGKSGFESPRSTTPKRTTTTDVTSLTDNLLNLPKRAKAADFF